MRITLAIFTGALLMLVVGQGCYTPRYAYSGSAHNVPLVTSQGDSKAAINFSSNLTGRREVNGTPRKNKASGFDAQAAYAFGKKWYAVADYFQRREINEGDYSYYRDSATIRYKRNLFEIGAGRYKRLNDDSSLVFQFAGGVGFGKFSFTDNGLDASGTSYSKYHSSHVFKLYLQPSWTYQYRKRVAATLSSRFSLINYQGIATDYSKEELNQFQLAELSRGPIFFWEPGIINSFGFKKIPGLYLEYQLGLSMLMGRRFVDARFLNFSAGIYVDPPLLLRQKKQKPGPAAVTPD